MFYTKINKKEISLIDLPIFCRCPRCGKEIEVTADYWDFWGDLDFDPFESAIYCDSCSSEMNAEKEYITENIAESLTHAPHTEAEKILEFVRKYAEI